MTENIFSPKDIDSLFADVFDTNIFKKDAENKKLADDSLVTVKRRVIGKSYSDLPNIYIIIIEYDHNFSYVLHHQDIQKIISLDDGKKYRFVDEQRKTVDAVRKGDYVYFDSSHDSRVIRVPVKKLEIKEPYLSNKDIENIHKEIQKRLFLKKSEKD